MFRSTRSDHNVHFRKFADSVTCDFGDSNMLRRIVRADDTTDNVCWRNDL